MARSARSRSPVSMARARSRSPVTRRALPPAPPPRSVLWIGGTSALARTFFVENLASSDGGGCGALAQEVRATRWIAAAPECDRDVPLPASVSFVPLDLRSEESVSTLFARLPHSVDAIVLGARISLVWGDDSGGGSGGGAAGHLALAAHLRSLVSAAASVGVRGIVHLSSVAIANHVVDNIGLSEADPLPDVSVYKSAYDAFKRATEDGLDAAVAEYGLACVHLRLSGIFSNASNCIQCTAVRRQARLAANVDRPIDFNSSYNVGVAVWLALGALGTPRAPVGQGIAYYYTRPTARPVAYSHHVKDYRVANGIRLFVDVPAVLADAAVALLRCIMQLLLLLTGASCFRGLHYMLCVASAEHSFDNSRFRTAFPRIQSYEESIQDAFRRIRRRSSAEST